MKVICFATNNQHKLAEVRRLLRSEFQIVSLQEIGCLDELPETQDTLEGNSLQKADFVFRKFGVSCFADDTGLEVEALQGEPGVHSAHYAGSSRSAEANMSLVLAKLTGEKNRRARFRTVITLLEPGGEKTFEGFVRGEILTGKRGAHGFGYDPIFQPEGSNYTFAEISLDEKNKLSHRGMAIQQLVTYLLQRDT